MNLFVKKCNDCSYCSQNSGYVEIDKPVFVQRRIKLHSYYYQKIKDAIKEYSQYVEERTLKKKLYKEFNEWLKTLEDNSK